jgi:hypothetical protein
VSDQVRYEERNSIAIITINRPEKLNTLTEAVVQGVADGIDAATAARDVRAVVLRGEGQMVFADDRAHVSTVPGLRQAGCGSNILDCLSRFIFWRSLPPQARRQAAMVYTASGLPMSG